MPWSPDAGLLTQLLPLALGAAVSPMVLVLQLLTLSAPRRGVSRSLAYLVGCSLVVLLWLGCAGWIMGLLPQLPPGPDPIAAALDALFALLLLSAGAWMLVQPPALPRQSEHPGLLMPGVLGMAAMGCNLTSLVLFLPAIHDISRAGLQDTSWWAMALLVMLFTLLPAWLPPTLVLVGGDRSRSGLQTMAAWVTPRQRGINASVAFALAVVLLGRSLMRL